MPKFDILFPHTPINKTPADVLSEDEYCRRVVNDPTPIIHYYLRHALKVGVFSLCSCCKEDTDWMSIYFGSYICSTECEEKVWQEISEA